MFSVLFDLGFVNFFLLLITVFCIIRFFYNFLFEELTLINSILSAYFLSLLVLFQLDLDFIGVIFCIIYVGFVLVLIIHLIRFFTGFGSRETLLSFKHLFFLFFPFLIFVVRKYDVAFSPLIQSNSLVELDLLNAYDSLLVGCSKPILSQVSDYMYSFDGLITIACILTLLTATIGVIIINKYGNKK